ncbi:MAG: neutral zinc metallopeptidase [Actinobacteria bacterium]|nr:neutral zinc metallopeptidase [Actinomycetota bacterium]
MKWRGRRTSQNVEDRRGTRRGGLALGGGVGSIILAVLFLLLGGNPAQLLTQGGVSSQQVAAPTAEEQELADFIGVVLADTEEVWQQLFEEEGRTYQEPRLYDELRRRHAAPGDFAQAYVVAHEVGHHVQNLLGISEQVSELRSQVSETEYNQYLVRLELQADFLAGVWAYHAQENWQVLEPGDIDEALQAASVIGDDRLQKEATGRVVPDSFTHGTSEQRVRWFRKGLDTGDMSQGDTFSADQL